MNCLPSLIITSTFPKSSVIADESYGEWRNISWGDVRQGNWACNEQMPSGTKNKNQIFGLRDQVPHQIQNRALHDFRDFAITDFEALQGNCFL